MNKGALVRGDIFQVVVPEFPLKTTAHIYCTWTRGRILYFTCLPVHSLLMIILYVQRYPRFTEEKLKLKKGK